MADNFYFWPQFWFLAKNLIFDQNFDFWPKLWFLTKTSISSIFWPKPFKNQIFDRNFDFCTKFWFLTNNFDFWPKIGSLTKTLIFDQNFDFVDFLRKKNLLLTKNLTFDKIMIWNYCSIPLINSDDLVNFSISKLKVWFKRQFRL